MTPGRPCGLMLSGRKVSVMELNGLLCSAWDALAGASLQLASQAVASRMLLNRANHMTKCLYRMLRPGDTAASRGAFDFTKQSAWLRIFYLATRRNGKWVLLSTHKKATHNVVAIASMLNKTAVNRVEAGSA